MSTLADIPFGGWMKYGCLGVYDTDAKREFLGVKVDDVYTHRCAKEMAIGALTNSNASLAIAVTGNAMSTPRNVHQLGEVFIGIAGYNKDGIIIYETSVINACNDIDSDFKELCFNWYEIMSQKTIAEQKNFPALWLTANISQSIRYYTTYIALKKCLEFVEKNSTILDSPRFLKERKDINSIHIQNKCWNSEHCKDSDSDIRTNTKVMPYQSSQWEQEIHPSLNASRSSSSSARPPLPEPLTAPLVPRAIKSEMVGGKKTRKYKRKHKKKSFKKSLKKRK